MFIQILILTAIYLVGFMSGAHVIGNEMGKEAIRFATGRFGKIVSDALDRADISEEAKAEVVHRILEEMSNQIQRTEQE